MTNFFSRCVITAAAAAAGLPAAASAQSVTSGAVLEEVIVTAQRREESLQQTPVSIRVLTSEALAERAIASELDLQTSLPGLTVKAGQTANQLNYAIRGQTIDSFSSSRPAVLPYFNELQVGGSASTSFYDLGSVQVLKGPQGTLFGRNSTGGAVLFTSAKPTNELGGYVAGWAGDYSDTKIEGALNIPLVEDKLLMRISAFYRDQEGYQHNRFTNSSLGDMERQNARLSLTFNPTDRITNEFVFDYANAEGTNISSVAYNAFAIGEGAPFVPSNFLYSPLVDLAFGAGAWDAFLAAHPGADPDGWNAFVDKQNQRGPFDIDVDAPNFHLSENIIVSNITTIELSDTLQLRSILGYTDIENWNASEFDGTPYPSDDNGEVGRGGELEQFSAELQLQGTAFDTQLEYVTGIYYSDEEDDVYSLSVLFDLLPAAPAVEQINAGVITNDTIAVYAQGTLDLSDLTGSEGLALTLGGRFSEEEVTFDRTDADFFITSPVPPGATYVDPLNDTFNQFSWTAGLEKQVNDELLVYLFSRRSYRSGGFNFFAPPVPGFGSETGAEYMEERATDIEFGIKYQGALGDTPFRLNTAIYQMWIDDIQRSNYVSVFGSLAGITVNVPEAQIKGIEIDAEILPTEWLSLGAALNYTDAEFTKNRVSVLGNPSVEFGPYPDTPEFSGSIYADMSFPLQNGLNVFFRTDVYHQTETYFSSTDATLNPGTRIPGYSVTDFRLGIEHPDNGWSLAAYFKNAFDETYYVGGIGFKSLFAVNTVIPGPPRTYMLEARYSF